MHHIGITCKRLSNKYGLEWITACDLVVEENTYRNMSLFCDGKDPQHPIEFYNQNIKYRKDVLIPIKSSHFKTLQVNCPICDSWLQLKELAYTQL